MKISLEKQRYENSSRERNKSEDILLYAISTCGWCKKTKILLDELDVEYRYINVNLVDKTEMEKIEKEVKK